MNASAIDELVVAARSGGGWAFERLYGVLAPTVLAYLRTQGAEDPEGLTNEVFLRVFRGLDGFDGDGSAFRSWVFTIAHHRIVDERRRRKRRIVAEPLTPAQDSTVGGDAEEDALDVIGNREIAALLGQLSPDQRAVVALRVLADLSIAETARVLHKRETAIKALQRRALAALRTEISYKAVSS